MSSLDALRAPPRSGVTYNTPYMHHINREYLFTSFVSLSAIDPIFTTDFTAGIKSIEAQRSESFVWSLRHVDSSWPFALHQQIL